MKNRNLFKIIFISILLLTQLSQAKNTCENLFLHSESLISDLQKTSLTAGQVNLYNKKIPVVLVNHKTVDQLKSIYNQSIGVVVTHQKGYKNDHGLFRLGDYFIDRDTPTRRNRGEIHSTGLSWSAVKDYTAYTFNLNGGYKRIEVLFKLTNEEYSTAMIYQKMRRAAIIRPDFNFGGDSNPKNVNNRMTDCGEICFSFSSGSVAREQARSAKRYIMNSGLHDYELLRQNKEFQTLINQAKAYLNNSSITAMDLNPAIVDRFSVPSAITDLKLSATSQSELIRWVIGAEISLEYAQLLETLRISNSSDYSNVRSPRASAVLVYDGTTSKEEFSQSDYVSEGIFSTWRNTDFEPLQKIENQERKRFFGLF
jgi:hypothetical protein